MKPCPSCDHYISVHEGYQTWCEACNWNLNLTAETHPRSAWERIEKRMRETYGRTLFEKLQKQPHLLTKKGSSERMASLLSLAIIGCSLIGFLAGVYGLFKWYESPLIILGSVSLLIISWLSRPRPNRIPKQVMILEEAQHPLLYKTFMQMEKELGIERRIVYALSPRYEAYTTEIGWRRTPLVVVGYPLLFACTPEELSALVSHELAHCRNSDVRRSGLVAHALRILVDWCDMLDPATHEGDEDHDLAFVHLITKWVMRILFWIPYSLLFLLIHLFWNQSQRAEYEADRLAAQVAGSDAMISMLHTIHLDHVYEMVVGKHALQKQTKSLGDHLAETFAFVPAKEKTRTQRMLENSDQSLDTTHPSTYLRIAMLQQNPQQPLCQIPKEVYEHMRKEIHDQTKERFESWIIDAYRVQYF